MAPLMVSMWIAPSVEDLGMWHRLWNDHVGETQVPGILRFYLFWGCYIWYYMIMFNYVLCLMYCLTLYIFYVYTYTLYIHNIIHNIIYIYANCCQRNFRPPGCRPSPLVPGGHTEHILSRLSGSGRLIAFDVEPLGMGWWSQGPSGNGNSLRMDVSRGTSPINIYKIL
jgi:hypothetical protein